MKFTLKDYQDDAVEEVLDRLKKARKRWHEDRDKHAFSLTATTGAGKTVMAAAVFEALFHGNDDYEFEPDPGAVMVWFSDDPSLNEQSRWRLQEASDKLTISDLVTVDNTFGREKFEAGKIYFLNTQKLSKNSLLVRGHNPNDAAIENDDGQMRIMPDLRSHTIWDTIQNTIEDPALTLYLVLDEAHRGMKEGGKSNGDGKLTIVKQLINGSGSVPGIPIVWGISATVERFNDAIKGMQGRATLPNVVVDPKKVQDSGLLKDTINLDIPDEEGDFSTVLLRRGTDKLREISKAWTEYATQQDEADTVLPLMVFQVPNSPDHKEIGKWLDTIFDRWPELPPDCIANVFGEHKTETFGSRTAPYIAPERVQESDWVRILVAKDAISTGWDCPRAEVMVSFRAASDKTHITQLLGRMVRTPLARRIPGNDRLNAVDCLLPRFNKKSAEAVVTALMTGSESGEELPGRRVLINPREMKPNLAIPEEVWQKLLSLPSQTLPKRQARPVKRLTALAHELAADALLADAGKKAHAEMHKVLDGAQVRYAEEIKRARDAVLTVEGKTVKADVKTKAMSFNDFVEAADYAVIEDAYKRAARVISPDLATTYSEHLASKAPKDNDAEDALIEAHTAVAAIGLVPDIKADLEAAAEKLSNQWLSQYRISVKSLSDERQEVYRQIREMSAHPLDVDLARPHFWLQATKSKETDGTEVELPRFERHMLCDEDGLYPENFRSSWEPKVLLAELQRDGNVGWYRNPARASQDSLGVTYEDADEMKIVRPDFIFFARLPDGSIAADIIDPHGIHLSDALPRLRGLAEYAGTHQAVFRRIEIVAEVAGTYRLLDLTESSVREAVQKAESAKALFQSGTATDYRLGTIS
jgi:type III restriction enzyme